MREWLLLAVVFAPLAALCVVQQRGEDPPDWAVAIALAWFGLVGAAIGWYQGWFKRLFVAILVFIPIMIAIAWLAGGEGTATWPTWLNLLLIAGPIGVLVVLGTWTGWFTDAARSIKEMVAKHPPACEKCLTARKDLVWFEASAGMAEQRRRSLCPECVWNEIERQLSGWINPVLVAEPVRNANGYYSLNADGVAEWWGSEDDRPTREATTRRVLSAVGDIVKGVSGSCEECGAAEATVCWVPGEAFRSRWDKFSELLGYKPEKLLNNESLQHLCGGCAARSARKATHTNRVRLYLVNPPSADTLVMLPGEA